MEAEILCEVNQVPPELVFVNGEPLSQEELVQLQNCKHPPKNLRPGCYWYDRVSGFWGKVSIRIYHVVVYFCFFFSSCSLNC